MSNSSTISYAEAAASVPNARWYRILLPVMTLCIISYVDRTNIGFAMAGGMSKDLAMSASFAGFAAGVFFLGYIFLQVPAGHLAAHGRAKNFLTLSMIAWGVISILTSFVTSNTQLVALRFVLGLAEGGMLPIALTMIAQWFPNEERGRATALLIMFVPIANIVSGPLAGLIIEHLGWRNLFLIEGVATFFLILPWMLTVTEDPRKAKWISPEERDFIVSRLAAEQSVLAERPLSAKASLAKAMGTSEMWKLIAINFLYQTAIYAFVIWLPTVIKNLTQSNMVSTGYLSMLPYIATMIGMYAFGRLSDRSGDRKTYVAVPLLGLAASLLFSVLLKDSIWLSFSCLVLAGGFLQSAASVFWTIPPLLFPSAVAGGVRGAINALGNLGGFLGPYLLGILKDWSGSTDFGILTLVGFLVISAAITFTLPIHRDGSRA